MSYFAASHLERVVADGSDRKVWLAARRTGVTATDAAKLCTTRSVAAVARDKAQGAGFTGNAFTEHGKMREPLIAARIAQDFGIAPSSALFHAPAETRHLATPDGVVVRSDGVLELAEIKTTNKEWRTIPRNYLRQVWWQQYVLGAERTLLVWERHENFVPCNTLQYRWVERDESEIAKLVGFANQLLKQLPG